MFIDRGMYKQTLVHPCNKALLSNKNNHCVCTWSQCKANMLSARGQREKNTSYGSIQLEPYTTPINPQRLEAGQQVSGV